jgi:hypothetical protein
VILSQAATRRNKSVKVYISVGTSKTPEYGGEQNMIAGAKALADKLSKIDVLHLELKFSIISGAYHETAFPTTAIQGLDYIYIVNSGHAAYNNRCLSEHFSATSSLQSFYNARVRFQQQ